MQLANEEGVVNPVTIKKYLPILKDCSVNLTSDCFMTCPSGWGCGSKPTSSDMFITADGMKWGDFSSGTADPAVAVDLNGDAAPNKLNYDILTFCINKDGSVAPGGTPTCNLGGATTSNSLNWLQNN